MKLRWWTQRSNPRWIQRTVAALAVVAAISTPAARGQQENEAEKQTPADKSVDDVQDLVLLGPLRPLHVRLHILVDRQPFRKPWRDRVTAAFGEADADGDGRVTAEQAAKLIAGLTGQGEAPAAAKAAEAASPSNLGGDTDVSLSAVLTQLEKVAPPLTLRAEPGVSGTAIFAILDADGDRRLSLEELRNAERLLRRRDFNDDEAIAADELIEDPQAQSRHEPAQGGEPAAHSAVLGAVLCLEVDTSGQLVAASLLSRYDRNRDGRLTVKGAEVEVGLEPAVLAALSLDANGCVSADDLAVHCRKTIDVEIPISLGAGGTGRSAASTDGTNFKVRKRLSGDLKIEGAGVELDLRRNNRNPLRNSGQEYALSEYDTDNNDYLDEAEVKQAPLIANSFAKMDGDHDGKVFKAEFESYMRRQAQAAGARLVLRVTDRGQDLFDLLDATPDNQLSVREILAAPKLLQIADRNGDGYLGGDEISQRLEWELERGTAELTNNLRLPGRAPPRGPNKADQTTGPKWFAAMDRNQDGDLSAREFLGSQEDFQRLDSDHDGLIDAVEAAAAK